MATKSKSTNNNGNVTTMVWHTMYDDVISKAKGAYGTVPSPDAYRLATTLGTGKRPGVEALYIAMALRNEGCDPDVFVAVKGRHGYANNCLQYLNDEGARALYKVIHVTKLGKVRVARLTAKGEAQMKAAGMTATALKPFMGKVTAPAPVKPQAPAKPATPVTTKRKPAGKPIQAPANKPAPAAPAKPAEPAKPHPVMTEAGPKMPAPAETK